MHRPPAFRADLDAARALIEQHALAQLVVVADGLPVATPVPMIVRGDHLVGHLARPNPVWHHPGPALALFSGVDAYVSPRWYENKTIDGKVVPTWNYSTVQVRGTLVAHDDAAWTLQVVTDLSDHFERAYGSPWAVRDAPDDYVHTLLRGIVGIELIELEIVGKAKLSQNRPDVDQERIVAAFADGTPSEAAVAAAMTRSRGD